MTFKKTFEDSAGGGESDHGALTGLSDDDHPQYLTQAEADALYKALGYIPSWAEITGKPTTFPPSAHKTSHATGGADALVASDIGAAAGSHVGSTDGHPLATTTLGGFQSAAGKAKLDSIPAQDTISELTRSAVQSIAHNTWTPVKFDVESNDPYNWHSTAAGSEHLVTPGAGRYLINGYMRWALNYTGNRFLRLMKNGAEVLQPTGTPAETYGGGAGTLHWAISMIAGDTFSLETYQNSGANLDLLADVKLNVWRIK